MCKSVKQGNLEPADRGWQFHGNVAIPLGGYIYINLKGRQPEGIVPADEYEILQEQIIDILLDIVCPVTRKHPFALVCKRQDGEILEIDANSSNTGDVIYLLRTPFRVDPVELIEAVLPDFQNPDWRKGYSNGHYTLGELSCLCWSDPPIQARSCLGSKLMTGWLYIWRKCGLILSTLCPLFELVFRFLKQDWINEEIDNRNSHSSRCEHQ
jgi:hypothetical protein